MILHPDSKIERSYMDFLDEPNVVEDRTRVVFKVEETIGPPEAPTDARGPMKLVEPGMPLFASRPFDPGRKPDPWVLLSEAEKIAQENEAEMVIT
jgi:hypothetical protein